MGRHLHFLKLQSWERKITIRKQLFEDEIGQRRLVAGSEWSVVSLTAWVQLYMVGRTRYWS